MNFIIYFYADNPTPLGKPKELRNQVRIEADSAHEAWREFVRMKIGRAAKIQKED